MIRSKHGGRLDIETARKDSWRMVQPMPQETAVLDCKEEFSAEEFERISCGLIPQEMEDKWFIYLDEGNTLHLHRSWTGCCIYQVDFAAAEGKHVVRRAVVNRDPTKHVVRRAVVNRDPTQHESSDDAYDAAVLRFLISNLLLGRQTAFPIPRALAKDQPKGLWQHHLTGTAYPEKVMDSDQSVGSAGSRSSWKFWQRWRCEP